LDEVTVKKTRQKKYYSTFEHWAEDFRRFDSTDIANMEGETVLDVIKKLPDVMVIGNQVIPASQPPTDKAICVFINGFPEEPVWLAWHPKKYLLSVNYIEGSVATTLLHPYTTDSSFIKQYLIKGINTKEDNKIIWVTTSDDTLMKPLVRHSIEFTPLGVSIPSKFYQPRYDVDSIRNNHKQRDTRTTLYWNPRLAFYAREKKKITFYTNDKRGYYYMVIEGITREGIPIRRVQRIKLK